MFVAQRTSSENLGFPDHVGTLPNWMALTVALTGSGLGFLDLWIIKFRHCHLHMSEGNPGQPQHHFSDARGSQLLFSVGWSWTGVKSREASFRGNFHVLMKASASSRTNWETKFRDWQPSCQKTIQDVCPPAQPHQA